MPNHVRTVIKFKHLKTKDDFDFIIHMIARPLPPSDDMFTPDHEDYIIDFNKIIPEPTTEEECPKWALLDKGDSIEVESDRPWFNWYRWRLEKWDTKWGAYDGYTIREKTSLAFVFSTAWSTSMPIIRRLMILNYDFEVLYADEDWGHNCGKIIYKAKTQDYTYTFDDDVSKDPKAFAKRIWDKY